MNIGLFYFSGTGSTHLVSKYLSSNLEKLSNTVEMYRIEDILKNSSKVDFKTFDMIGFVLPIYAFGVPPHVFDFIKLLPRNEERAFIIRTASFYSSINNSASEKLIKALNENWYTVFYERILVLSSNFLIDMDDELTKKLYEVTIYGKVPNIAKDISRGNPRRYKKNFLREILSNSIYSFYNNFLRKAYGRSLSSNLNYKECKACIKNCPTNNLMFSDNKLVSGENCIMCMRCAYNSPNNEIYSKGLDFFAFRCGYDYFSIIKNKNIGSKKFSVSKKMWKYISDDDK